MMSVACLSLYKWSQLLFSWNSSQLNKLLLTRSAPTHAHTRAHTHTHTHTQTYTICTEICGNPFSFSECSMVAQWQSGAALSPGAPASSPSPMMQIGVRLIGDSKLTVGVNVILSGCCAIHRRSVQDGWVNFSDRITSCIISVMIIFLKD